MRYASKTLIILSLVVLAERAHCQRTPDWQVSGIIDTPQFHGAIVYQRNPVRLLEFSYVLQPGQRVNTFELLSISQTNRSVEVNIEGAKTNLTLAIQGEAISGLERGVDLANADLNAVLEIYGRLSKRTPLIYPSLQGTKISGQIVITNAAEILHGMEKTLLEQKVSLIPSGVKFVMVVPTATASNAIAQLPKPDEAGNSASASVMAKDAAHAIPSGEIDFPRVPLAMVLDLYGQMVGSKDHIRTDQVRPKDFQVMITTKTQTPLTVKEACYAFDTLFAWNGYKVVRDADGVSRAVPLSTK